eukprot:10273837-Lingulodinium_polyedra.AAC.1
MAPSGPAPQRSPRSWVRLRARPSPGPTPRWRCAPPPAARVPGCRFSPPAWRRHGRSAPTAHARPTPLLDRRPPQQSNLAT